MTRIPATCAAIRAAKAAALDLALEAEMDGRPGIARALRRKVHAPRPGDWQVHQYAQRVEARIAAYGAVARGVKHVTAPVPEDAEAVAQAAVRMTR